MAATVADVRLQIGDTEEPYFFDDAAIQQALDEAEGYLGVVGVNIESVLGTRAHKLQASIYLISTYLANLNNKVVRSIREGDISIEYVDLQTQLDKWREELDELVFKLQDPIEVKYDDF